MRCPDCASLRSTALYQIHPARLALAAVVGVLVGVPGAILVSQLTFFVIFAAPFYGGVVAEAVLRAAGRKRGPAIEIIGVGSIVLGFLIALLPELLVLFGAHHTLPSSVASPAIAYGVTSIVWRVVAAALSISACYGRLKYL